jgi:hypothetical protein
MVTAAHVDNGPRLPLLDHLPVLAFWLLPSAIGAPVIARAVIRAGVATPKPQAASAARPGCGAEPGAHPGAPRCAAASSLPGQPASCGPISAPDGRGNRP